MKGFALDLILKMWVFLEIENGLFQRFQALRVIFIYFISIFREDPNWLSPIYTSITNRPYLHDDVILLSLLPESFRVLLSYANYGFCYLTLTGISKFKYERKNEMNSGPSSKKASSCKWPISLAS